MRSNSSSLKNSGLSTEPFVTFGGLSIDLLNLCIIVEKDCMTNKFINFFLRSEENRTKNHSIGSNAIYFGTKTVVENIEFFIRSVAYTLLQNVSSRYTSEEFDALHVKMFEEFRSSLRSGMVISFVSKLLCPFAKEEDMFTVYRFLPLLKKYNDKKEMSDTMFNFLSSGDELPVDVKQKKLRFCASSTHVDPSDKQGITIFELSQHFLKLKGKPYIKNLTDDQIKELTREARDEINNAR